MPLLEKITGWRRFVLGAAVVLFCLEVCFLLDHAVFLLSLGHVKSGQFNATMRAMKCWGDAPTLLFLAAGMFLAAPARGKSVLCMLIASLLTASAVEVIKPVANRARPSETALIAADSEPKAINGRNSSFPSGHAATAFAFARALSLAHPAVAPVCYVAAAGTAMSRIFEQRHYLSDCFAGAVLGWCIATGCWSLKGRWESRPSRQPSVHQTTPALRLAS
jgi:undecaprenyl-diphosphatase